MTMIRYAEFEPALRDRFESICASKKVDPSSFQVMAIISVGELNNGFGRVYVRRNGMVRDCHAGRWLTEFEAEVAEQFGQEPCDIPVLKTDMIRSIRQHPSFSQISAPTLDEARFGGTRPGRTSDDHCR